MANIRNQALIDAFGRRIRELRTELNLSMEDLADLCGIEYRQLSRIELGEINTSISMADRLGAAFNMELRDLFDFPTSRIRKE